MSKFSRSRKSPPTSEAPSDFIRAANERQLEVQSAAEGPPSAEAAWLSLDPNEKPSRSLSLRLNDYELARLRHAAKKTRRSIQQMVKMAVEQVLNELLDDEAASSGPDVAP